MGQSRRITIPEAEMARSGAISKRRVAPVAALTNPAPRAAGEAPIFAGRGWNKSTGHEGKAGRRPGRNGEELTADLHEIRWENLERVSRDDGSKAMSQ